MNTQAKDQTNKNWARPFFTIWTGQALSLLGSQLVSFALIWWLTKTTGSGTILATATLVGLLPQVLLGPIAGTLVDRWNRRIIMIVADSVIAMATVALAVLFALGEAQIAHVYVLMFIRSLAGGFHWPAMSASTSLMVPKEHLSRIQGFNQMLQGGLNIAAAPVAALLLEFMPLQGILAIDVGTAIIAILPLLFIAIPQPERKMAVDSPDGKTSVWQDFRSGLSYMASWPGLIMIGIMATIINFVLTPASTLLPLMVTKHFGGDAIQFAGLESIWGIGMLIGGLLLGAWGGFKRRVYTSMIGLLGIGAGSLILGFVPSTAYWLAVVAMFLLGFFNPITNGPLMAALQATVEPEMQGRIFTLISSAAAAMSPLGLILAGPLADAYGVQTWFIIGGVVTVIMGVSGFFIPAVVNFEDGPNSHFQAMDEPVAVVTQPAEIE
jgi:DHA3 family macrolide efflux protein-like MFS transporter